MKRSLIFYEVKFDAVFLEQDKLQYTFFTDFKDSDSPSAAEESEQKIVEWLFESPFGLRSSITSFLFPNHREEIFWQLEVTDFKLHDRKIIGDIDVILCPMNRPDRCIAIQVKKIKVRADNNDWATVNGLNRIDKGIEQVKITRQIGFYKTYLVIVIVNDGRNLEKDTMFRGPLDEKVADVYDIPFRKELPSDVGVMYWKLTQPTGKTINFRADFGVCIDKPAKACYQKVEITNRVRDLIKERS